MDDYPEAGARSGGNTERQVSGSPQADPVPARPRYQRQVPHVTQAPIDDVEVPYVTRERYQTLEQERGGAGRLHMGTATSDPDYLPPTPATGDMPGPAHPLAPNTGRRQITHSARYLQTPKPGKSIFTSRVERARKRTHRLIAALIALVIVVVLAVVFIIK